MEPAILDKTNRLFNLSAKAGLLTTESFSDVFPAEKLLEISSEISKDKSNFISNNLAISDPDKLWNEGVETRISDDISEVLMDFLEGINKVFMVNWDQPVEDIVYNFQTVSSDLDITDVGEYQVDGEWYQGMKIDDKLFEYKVCQEGFVPEVLGEISKSLSKLSKVIMYPRISDENQYFVIDIKFIPEFESLGFYII